MIIVVTAAPAQAKEQDVEGGERTFAVGLSADGEPPATHTWCDWALEDAGAARVFNGNHAGAGEGAGGNTR